MAFDMILIHAPSVYDFRNRNDILFAYLSNSDSVHVSPIFEMPPVGIFAIKQHLQRCGFIVEFFNIASQMLRYPEFDVELFFKNAPAKYFGVDLHFLVHAHGALELAKLYKEIHPSAETVVGGISSTYFHEELISYPYIDYVVRGYDTLIPIELLLRSGGDPYNLRKIPNLCWKSQHEINVNEMSHLPSVYNAGVDWSEVFKEKRNGCTPYNIVIPQCGCEYNCKWCGGSNYFFKKHMGINRPAHKTASTLRTELQSIATIARSSHTITIIDFWHEYEKLFDAANDVLVDENIGYVHFMLNRLPSIRKGRSMSFPVKAIVELSPDSHDMNVAKAGGRGKYTMREMEKFIDDLIDDVYSFEVYFMMGLPEQTVGSIWETVEYCEHLLKKYRDRRVIPYLCPMLPFLDPGSMIFDNARKEGYKIFCYSLKEHYNALLSMSWKNRLNYETKWLSREELVNVSYDSVRALTLLKHKYGVLPSGITNEIVTLVDSTKDLLKEIDNYNERPHDRLLAERLKTRILKYNNRQFEMVRSQQRPVDLGFTKQQWFDTDVAFDKLMSDTS